MTWVIIGAGVALVLIASVASSLRAAARSRAVDAEVDRRLAALTEVRSPSGKRFFDSDESIWELAGELDELAEPDAAPPRESASP